MLTIGGYQSLLVLVELASTFPILDYLFKNRILQDWKQNYIADKFNKHFNNALLYIVSSLIAANPDWKSECNNTEAFKKAAYVPKSYI